jgi:hypothetical protein
MPFGRAQDKPAVRKTKAKQRRKMPGLKPGATIPRESGSLLPLSMSRVVS